MKALFLFLIAACIFGGGVLYFIINVPKKNVSLNLSDASTPATQPYQDGTLVNDGGTIYIIEFGKKRAFVSMSVFTGLGYKLSSVINASLGGIPNGPVVGNTNQRHPRGSVVVESDTIYYLGDTARHPFSSPAIFSSWGYSFSDVVPANSYDLKLPIGSLMQMKQ